jgi:hypothetical protein
MKAKTNLRKRLLLRLILLSSLLLNIVSLWALIYPAYEAGLLRTHKRWQAVSTLSVLSLVIEAIFVAVVWAAPFSKIRISAYRVTRWLARYKNWNLVAYSLSLIV